MSNILLNNFVPSNNYYELFNKNDIILTYDVMRFYNYHINIYKTTYLNLQFIEKHNYFNMSNILLNNFVSSNNYYELFNKNDIILTYDVMRFYNYPINIYKTTYLNLQFIEKHNYFNIYDIIYNYIANDYDVTYSNQILSVD